MQLQILELGEEAGEKAKKKKIQRYDIRDALVGKRYLREKLISNSESKVNISLEMVKLPLQKSTLVLT